MEKNSGYVYALINPSIQGLVRIEITKGDPRDGARDLSIASRTATPYIVLFQQWFEDCTAAAALVQKRLVEYVSAEHESFFKVSNTEAVLAIMEVKGQLDQPEVEEKVSDSSTLEDTAKRNRRKFCEHLLMEGQIYQYGDSSTPKDEAEAIKVYEKAIDMNCFDANRLLGTLYYERYVFLTAARHDLQKALKYFESGISRGNTRCWGDSARCYEKLKEYRNAEICWGNFWQHSKDGKNDLDENSQGLYAARFQEYMNSPARQEHRKLMMQVATNNGENFKELPEGRNEVRYTSLFSVEYQG